MKILLIGHPSSQVIVPASKYLTDKYLPQEDMFEIIYLNHTGPIEQWAFFVRGYLKTLDDELVIMALDDYLISGPINLVTYFDAENEIRFNDGISCVKLCECSEQEQEEYPCTTQYTIWNREFLIRVLTHVSTPWDFEIEGSKFLKSTGVKAIVRSCIPYFTNSSLSRKWEGVRLDGLSQQDGFHIKTMMGNG